MVKKIIKLTLLISVILWVGSLIYSYYKHREKIGVVKEKKRVILNPYLSKENVVFLLTDSLYLNQFQEYHKKMAENDTSNIRISFPYEMIRPNAEVYQLDYLKDSTIVGVICYYYYKRKNREAKGYLHINNLQFSEDSQ